MELKKSLIEEIISIINTSQARAIRLVDTERLLMYWQIGKVIFEEEQEGKDRADYGEFLIRTLSEVLISQHGTGFSYRQLNLFRQFYRVFPIMNALRSQFSWTHYRTLIRIDNQYKREFYIAEGDKNMLAKTALFAIAVLSTQVAFSQVGMGNFMQDLAGSSGSGGSGGSGVPIDGGISAMIAGSVYYGYKQMKKKRNSVK